MGKFDPRTPSIARVYDYWMGGKDNFAADRELAERLVKLYPPTPEIVRENKQFLTRAVTWVASQGIRQFIDLGSGMPTSPSTLETARAVHLDARVACVDNDPVVVSHLRALVAHANASVTVTEEDVRNADAVLAAIVGGIDLEVPACLIMGSLLHFFPAQTAKNLLDRYTGALAPGSYLVVSIGRSDGEASKQFISQYQEGGSSLYYYSAEEIAALLTPFEAVPPGIAEARVWRHGWTDLPSLPPRTGEVLAAVVRIH